MLLNGSMDFGLTDGCDRGLNSQIAGTWEVAVITQRRKFAEPVLLHADIVTGTRSVIGMELVLCNQAKEWKSKREILVVNVFIIHPVVARSIHITQVLGHDKCIDKKSPQ